MKADSRPGWSVATSKRYGVALFNFVPPVHVRDCIGLVIGECVYIQEECCGWYRGYSASDRSKQGLFPANYIALKPFKVDRVTGQCEPLDQDREIITTIREWFRLLKFKLYIERDQERFQRLHQTIYELIEDRRRLLNGTLTQDQLKQWRLDIATKLDWGNRLVGMDVVPRIDGQVVDSESVSPIELFKIHLQSSEPAPANPQRNSNTSLQGTSANSHYIFLHVREVNLSLSNPEDSFIIAFSLIDANMPVTEKFITRIGANQVAGDASKLSLSTVFTDIPSDMTRDLQLHLLIQVFRIGKMLLVEGKTKASSVSSKTDPNLVRRPYGSAVISLADVIKAEGFDREVNVRLSACSNESDLHLLHEWLLRKQTNKLNQLQNSSVQLTLKFFTGTSLAKATAEHPLIFKNVSSLTGPRGFPDIILPGDVRNEIYVSLENGDFEKGGKSIPKNIEATISLVGADGKPIKGSVSSGSGIDPVTSYSSVVLYHNNNPRWNESIKILIPLNVFDIGAHVRFDYRHCSAKENSKEKKPLGFSFIPLSDEVGTILKDGTHELYVYKPGDSSDARAKANDPSYYLRLEYGPQDLRKINRTSSMNRSPKEAVHIKTLLCSTKLTQNYDLLALLKYKDNPNILETLKKVPNLNGEEIVKFLQDILDALFAMFSTGDGDSTAETGPVFKVLLHIFTLLEDAKFEQFKPILETYISEHFSAALVYKGLLICCKSCTEVIKDSTKQELIQQCFKSLRWIFKFVVQSRILFSQAVGDNNESLFRNDLYALFTSFHRMLSYGFEAAIVPTQVILIENLSLIYDELLRILAPTDLAHIIKLTINCLQFAEPPSAIVRAKLKCIGDTLANKKLFADVDARRDLLDVCAQHLREHINRQQELKACMSLLNDILDALHKEKLAINGSIAPDVEIMAAALFDAILRVIIELATTSRANQQPLSNSLVHNFIVDLVSLLRLMEDHHFITMMNRKKTRNQKKDLLFQVFYVFKQTFDTELLPADWMKMRLVTNHVILCSLQELSMTLISDFLRSEDTYVGVFDEQLWNSYFNLSVGFLTQPCLQLETFSEDKRNKILDDYGDMRVLMGFQILSMWNRLGDLKAHFIPSMIAPFLEITLLPEKELRRATLPIFYDMIDADYKTNGSFKQVEYKLIDKLDLLVSENKGDDEFRQLFSNILLEKVRLNMPEWTDQGIQLIQSITKLLELLLDYRYVMDGDENRDKRMSCTVNLLNFYKDEINRKEMYIRYIYKLAIDLHIPAENYTEAAFTLKLHADSLSWSWSVVPVPENGAIREQLEWQQKESLYLTIIDYFDKGKCWEEGLPLIKELAEFYEKRLFDYQKLSTLLKNQARFLDNILKELRPEPEYFRVGFYGKGFPLFLRNKLFVYRGLEYEKIGAFTVRLQNEFPQAQIMTKNLPPDESILASEGQHIQICNVKPIPEARPEFEGNEVPEKVTAYYQVNDVRSFQFDRPIHKGQIDKENEFKSLWLERTTLTIASKLPGILRWFEVIQKKVKEVSPLEHACEQVENMIRELQRLITSYTAEPTKPISPLSMRLQGVIEAAVNGGIAKYLEAFFNIKFIQLHSDQLHHIKRLKQLIMHQVRILEGGLSLHGRLVPPNIQPLHRRLVDRFTVMRHNVHEASVYVAECGPLDILLPSKRPSIINQPLPPIPIDNSYDGHYNGPLLETLPHGNGVSLKSEEEIYSVPHDCSLINAPILPDRVSPAATLQQQLPPPVSRPRSTGFSSLDLSTVDGQSPSGTPPPARPTAIFNTGTLPSDSVTRSIMLQRSRSIPRQQPTHAYTVHHQTSSSNLYSPSPTKETSNGNANSNVLSPPPLPPRSYNTLERNRSSVSSTNSYIDSPPPDADRPALPRRMRKTISGTESLSSMSSMALELENNFPRREPPAPPASTKKPAPPPPGMAPAAKEPMPAPVEKDRTDVISVTSVTSNSSNRSSTLGTSEQCRDEANNLDQASQQLLNNQHLNNGNGYNGGITIVTNDSNQPLIDLMGLSNGDNANQRTNGESIA